MLTRKEKKHIEAGCGLAGLGDRIQEELTLAAEVISADIADGAVTVGKLAAALQPSHVVKFAGEFTTVGGDAAESISVSGVLATDIVICQLAVEGASAVTLDAAVCAEDAINVTLSADPSTDHVLNYIVLRAIA